MRIFMHVALKMQSWN